MHTRRLLIAAVAATLAASAFFGGGGDGTPTASADAPGEPTAYLVLADDAADTARIVDELEGAGGEVTAQNADVGLVGVASTDPGFPSRARDLAGVQGVSVDRSIGRAAVGSADVAPAVATVPARTAATTRTDPLDTKLWGMRMIRADRAHAVRLGTHRVRVGVIDTGIDARHPDLRANFDFDLSRNFTTDIPAIDGPCEYAGCKDPKGVDQGGHGTHVAGTIAARLNGFGISGVAPGVDLVNLRAGQDSGYFFLQPVVNALTYAGNHGIDVVNMSFYVDPWLYNCVGGAPGDTNAQSEEQTTIVTAMRRATAFARERGVTLVAATGNEHDNLSSPRDDISSPNYPAGTEHDRPVDNASCFNLPVENANVIGVTALGPSERKADYSNYATQLTSGEVDVAAPGGFQRDGFGTGSYLSNGNMILSTYPRAVLQEEGRVDKSGNITQLGKSAGVIKRCPRTPYPGAAPCGFYAYSQGTSMATPHVTGVAALAVAAHGRIRPGGFGLAPKVVRSLVFSTARDHACPEGGKQSYLLEGRPAEWTATCVGTATRNGFYGWGIVNALAVLRK